MTRIWLLFLTVAFLAPLMAGNDEAGEISGEEDKGPAILESTRLTAPEFIDAGALSVSETGALRILLPNPNADGWDVAGTAQMAYEITLFTSEFAPLTSFSISGIETWPYLLETSFRVPETPYQVAIIRTAARPEGEQGSAARILEGPQITIASLHKMSDIDRWLLHVPRESGGFLGRIIIVNLLPETTRSIALTAFSESGAELQTQTLKINGLRLSLDLYGEAGLFAGVARDRISHIGVTESGGGRSARVKMVYRHHRTGASGQTVEMSLSDGVSGSAFLLDAMAGTEASFDGLALLNLRHQEPIRIYMEEYGENDEQAERAQPILLGSIPPGGKRLHAINGQWRKETTGGWYRIYSENGAPFQMLGLSGNATVLGLNPAVRLK